MAVNDWWQENKRFAVVTALLFSLLAVTALFFNCLLPMLFFAS